MSKQQKQPTRDAVATSIGWVCAKTGEVLVSIRGLENSVNLLGIPKRCYVSVIQKALGKTAKSEKIDDELISEDIVSEESQETTQDEIAVVEHDHELIVPETCEEVKAVKKEKKIREIHKSAESGEIVSEEFAKENPKTTYKTKVATGKKKATKKKAK